MAERYRPDIDGVRALAVLAVVFYHAFPQAVPGGFVGVDVFFVISGFLISGHILEALRTESFSFADFYFRRICRIFPALLVTLVAAWAIGWFILFPAELRELAKQTMCGAGFLSNFVSWRETGYFDHAAEAKPLLHLWSLAVEEQFYLLWPLALFWSWPRRVRIDAVIWLVFGASLALCLVQSETAAFYSPATRAWELMLGALLARADLARGRFPQIAGVAGITLLAGAIFGLDRALPYPGWFALLPTLGTALLIYARRSWINRLLSHRAIVGIGLISYPLYLWHWPLLAYARIAKDGELTVFARLEIIAISGALAWLTYRFVERHLRASRRRSTKAKILAGVACAMVALGVATYANHALEAAADAEANEDTERLLKGEYPMEDCAGDARIIGKARALCHRFGSHGHVVVVWGDSHANAWTPVLLDLAHEHGDTVYLFSHPGCPPVLHVTRTGADETCAHAGYADDVLESIRHLAPETVVLIARWSLYTHGVLNDPHAPSYFLTTDEAVAATPETSRAALIAELPTTIDALLTTTKRLVIFKNPPILKKYWNRATLSRNPAIEPTLAEHRRFEETTDQVFDPRAADQRVRIFDPGAFTCTSTCSSFLNGVPFYKDDNHVSNRGSFELRAEIARTIYDNI